MHSNGASGPGIGVTGFQDHVAASVTRTLAQRLATKQTDVAAVAAVAAVLVGALTTGQSNVAASGSKRSRGACRDVDIAAITHVADAGHQVDAAASAVLGLTSVDADATRCARRGCASEHADATADAFNTSIRSVDVDVARRSGGTGAGLQVQVTTGRLRAESAGEPHQATFAILALSTLQADVATLPGALGATTGQPHAAAVTKIGVLASATGDGHGASIRCRVQVAARGEHDIGAAVALAS